MLETSMAGYVYIVANRKLGTLYTGVTGNIRERITAHRHGEGAKFPAAHGCHRLVWLERFDEMAAAIGHEKRMKKWKRAYKINMIEARNPDWRDLYPDLMFEE